MHQGRIADIYKALKSKFFIFCILDNFILFKNDEQNSKGHEYRICLSLEHKANQPGI